MVVRHECQSNLILNKISGLCIIFNLAVIIIIYIHRKKMKFHKTVKKMKSLKKNVVNTLSGSGLRASQVINVLAHQEWGMEHVSFSMQQLYNYFQKATNNYHGRAPQSMFKYFKKRAVEDPNFFLCDSSKVNEIEQVGNFMNKCGARNFSWGRPN